MRLRNKTLGIIGLCWLVLLVLFYIGAWVLLLNSFAHLEMQRGFRNLSRIQEAFLEEMDAVNRITLDWAKWDDTYQYMVDENPAYIRSNLPKNTYEDNGLNAVLLITPAGKLLYGRGFNLTTGTFEPLPPELLAEGKRLVAQGLPEAGREGIVQLQNRLMIFTAQTIQNSDGVGPSRGILVMASYVDKVLIKDISAITKLPFTLIKLNKTTLSAQWTALPVEAASRGNYKVSILRRSNELVGYAYLKNINGKPVAIIKMQYPAEIYKQGRYTVHYYLWIFVVFALVISLILWFLIKYLVLNRLERLNSEVLAIGKGKAFSQRVTAKGRDEVAETAQELNGMLAMLEEAYGQKDKALQVETAQRSKAEAQLESHQKRLDYVRYYDVVTGLPNKARFTELLSQFMREHTRGKLAVIVLDIVNFKQVNDLLDQSGGDAVLKCIGQRFKESLQAPEVLAKSAGDEFIFCVPAFREKSQLMGRILQWLSLLKNPLPFGGHTFYLNAHVGVSACEYKHATANTLQKQAELAMYRSKGEKGSVATFFSESMDKRLKKTAVFEEHLYSALNNEEFVLYYQPKVSLKDEKIIGAEALIRWDSPKLGFIPPNEFIPLAERSGLIVEMGEWVIRSAMAQTKAWHAAGFSDLSVAINLSAVQFRDALLVEKIQAALDQLALSANYFEVEVTESLVMDDIAFAQKQLKAIHAIGINIAIDDFGTGHSSMNYLSKFSMDYMKIDKSFVDDIPQNKNNIAIIESLIALAHNLQLKVIAEGVETRAQLDFLKKCRCDIVQGYYYSRPLPVGEFSNFLMKGIGTSVKEK